MVGFIRENQIEGIDCTPSQLRSWISAGFLEGKRSQVRVVLVGGEPIDTELWNRLAGCAAIDFYNVYGPTESTVDATVAGLRGDSTTPHIGRPLESRQVHILDSHGQVVPIGVVGEIYLSGSGIARGYLNRATHTAERFLPNPFRATTDARMYKTGDLGRWRSNGTVEYLGRNDHQVKVRGIRIELAEIETQLVRHQQVRQAAVVARDDAVGEKKLVAYVTVTEGVGTTGMGLSEMLRAHLRSVLPEYMIPSAFVVMDALPITANGKLDLRALPAPKFGVHVSSKHESPRGPVEEALAEVWQNSLGVVGVGRHDNFFDLGGHSFLVLTTLFRINEHFGSELTVTDFYRSPTIRDLAARIGGDTNEDAVIDLSKEAILDDEIVAGAGLRRIPAQAILLTGATGFVGRFLLAQLLRDTKAKIYCLVRGQSDHLASERLRAALSKWDLWRDEFEPRVIAVPGDLRQRRFGLDATTYAMLSKNIDSIYHCATSMNHLETFELARPANVEAIGDLLRLATNQRPKVVNYISTLSVFTPSSEDATRTVSEETPIDHELHRSSAGYAASKWVAEKIIMLASDRGIPCNIFRLGLIWADTEQGRYDELQRVYRILKSCLISGLGIQNYRFDIAPTPVDYAARAIVLLAERHPNGGGIFHISSSEQKVDGIFERCNEIADTSLQLIPYYDWIQEMKRLHGQGHSLPAVPLIQFAFTMEEAAFYEWQRARRRAGIRFDLTRTHGELEQAGLVAPALNDEMLNACVHAMISRDLDLRDVMYGRRNVFTPKMGVEIELGDWRS
jgi:thioester reductase-like protein